MQVMLIRLMSKGEYLIVPKGTKFTGSGKLGLTIHFVHSPHQGNLQYPIFTPSFKYYDHHHHFSFSYIYTHNSLITFPVTMFSFPLIFSLIQMHNFFNGMTISVHKINKFYET